MPSDSSRTEAIDHGARIGIDVGPRPGRAPVSLPAVGVLVGGSRLRCVWHDHDLYIVLVDDPSRVRGTQSPTGDAVRGQDLQVAGDASEEMSG